jgi:polysaccharide export outer membrane protein
MLVLVFPVLAVMFVLVKATSKGPFIYRQARPGLHGKLFETLKIRSMAQGADADKALARSVKASNPHVTKVGRVLRNLKIDELPQLWNVVRGEMAFVGPRPIAVTLQQELEHEIRGFERRLSVRPGITNLGQVCVLESADPDRVVADWRMRFESELHYLKNRSPSYDIIIMIVTALYVMRKLFAPVWLMRQRLLKTLALLLVLVISVTLVGCAGTGHASYEDRSSVVTEHAEDDGSETPHVQSVSLDPEIQGVPEPRYLVGPGDVLAINIFGEPGMDRLRVPVDADGYIQLPFIERAYVDGKTTSEIQDQLKALFSGKFNDPWIVALVDEFGSKPLYLLGEFNSPGVIYLNRPTNILQAMGHGNGLTDRAYLRGARLLRNDNLVPVDINGLLKEGYQDQNLWLKAGDTIYVPDIREQKVIILGAVNNPLTLPINNDGMGLVELLAQAEGIRRGVSRLDQVRIIRSLSPVKGQFITVNAENIFSGVTPDFLLKPGDIVYVPQNGLGNWNDVVAAIKPSFELVTNSLQPFVQLKFLTDSD